MTTLETRPGFALEDPPEEAPSRSIITKKQKPPKKTAMRRVPPDIQARTTSERQLTSEETMLARRTIAKRAQNPDEQALFIEMLLG